MKIVENNSQWCGAAQRTDGNRMRRSDVRHSLQFYQPTAYTRKVHTPTSTLHGHENAQILTKLLCRSLRDIFVDEIYFFEEMSNKKKKYSSL